MFDAGSIVARVVADVSGFKQSLMQTTQEIKKYSTGFKGRLDAVNSSIEKHKAQIQGIATRLAVVGAAASAAAFSVVKMASDQAEVMNKTKEVFGKASDAIIQKSKESAKAVGASTTAYLDMASAVGNLIVPMGIAKDEAANISANMVTLAADLGSFNNTPTNEALEAIKAGLIGSSEPLRRFGIQLSEARIEEEMLASGLIKTSGEINQKAKAQAILNIIMRDSAAAQGDFGRTSDGLANSVKILQSEITNIATEIGTSLLPIALEIVNVLRMVIGVFSGLSDENKKLVAYVLALVVAIGVFIPPLLFLITMIPLLTAGFSALAAVIAFIASPITAVIIALGLMYLAWKTNFLGIRDITAEVWQNLKDAFTLGTMFIKDAFYAALNAITITFDATFEAIKETFKSVVNYIIDQVNSLIGLVNGVSNKLSFGKIKSTIPNIPKLAEGGIVTRPTLAMIGEGGESEAVIPLSKLGSSTGGTTINIYDSLVADEESAKNLLEKAFNSMNLAL